MQKGRKLNCGEVFFSDVVVEKNQVTFTADIESSLLLLKEYTYQLIDRELQICIYAGLFGKKFDGINNRLIIPVQRSQYDRIVFLGRSDNSIAKEVIFE